MSRHLNKRSAVSSEVPQVLRDFVLKNTSDAMLISHKDKVAEVNDAFLRLLGYSKSEMMGRRLSDFASPEDAHISDNRVARRAAGDHPTDSCVYRCVTKDGRLRYIHSSVIPWPANPDLAVAIARDITEQERDIETLKEPESLYRTLTETVPAGVILVDESGRSLYANDAARRITGHTATELSQGRFLENVNGDEARSLCARALGERALIDAEEVRLVRADGSTRWVAVSCRPALDDNSGLRFLQIALTDVTRHKAVEEALAGSEENLRIVLEHSRDIIWKLNTETYTYDYVSPASTQLLGFTPEEVVEMGLDGLVRRTHPEDVSRVHKGRTEGPEDAVRARPQIEYRMQRKDGTYRWFNSSRRIVRDEQGRTKAVVGVVRDVTDRRNAEDRLRAAHADLEKAYQTQRQFLNNVTHEVRTPLTAVRGYVEMLLEGTLGPLAEEQAELLKRVLASSDQLLKIVEGILDVTRAKTGGLKLHPKVVDPCKLVEDAVVVVLPQATQKGLSIDTRIPDRCALAGLYDEEKLAAIISNLLTNAVKFTDKGKIRVMLECGTSGMEVVIADPGMGIRQADLGSVFDEFQQLEDRRKHKPSGFGVGLAIVAAMVDVIGGSLTVSSRRGVGTAFTLYAPSLAERRPRKRKSA